jgi:hypothetical protein
MLPSLKSNLYSKGGGTSPCSAAENVPPSSSKVMYATAAVFICAARLGGGGVVGFDLILSFQKTRKKEVKTHCVKNVNSHFTFFRRTICKAKTRHDFAFCEHNPFPSSFLSMAEALRQFFAAVRYAGASTFPTKDERVSFTFMCSGGMNGMSNGKIGMPRNEESRKQIVHAYLDALGAGAFIPLNEVAVQSGTDSRAFVYEHDFKAVLNAPNMMTITTVILKFVSEEIATDGTVGIAHNLGFRDEGLLFELGPEVMTELCRLKAVTMTAAADSEASSAFRRASSRVVFAGNFTCLHVVQAVLAVVTATNTVPPSVLCCEKLIKLLQLLFGAAVGVAVHTVVSKCYPQLKGTQLLCAVLVNKGLKAHTPNSDGNFLFGSHIYMQGVTVNKIIGLNLLSLIRIFFLDELPAPHGAVLAQGVDGGIYASGGLRMPFASKPVLCACSKSLSSRLLSAEKCSACHGVGHVSAGTHYSPGVLIAGPKSLASERYSAQFVNNKQAALQFCRATCMMNDAKPTEHTFMAADDAAVVGGASAVSPRSTKRLRVACESVRVDAASDHAGVAAVAASMDDCDPKQGSYPLTGPMLATLNLNVQSVLQVVYGADYAKLKVLRAIIKYASLKGVKKEAGGIVENVTVFVAGNSDCYNRLKRTSAHPLGTTNPGPHSNSFSTTRFVINYRDSTVGGAPTITQLCCNPSTNMSNRVSGVACKAWSGEKRPVSVQLKWLQDPEEAALKHAQLREIVRSFAYPPEGRRECADACLAADAARFQKTRGSCPKLQGDPIGPTVDYGKCLSEAIMKLAR